MNENSWYLNKMSNKKLSKIYAKKKHQIKIYVAYSLLCKRSLFKETILSSISLLFYLIRLVYYKNSTPKKNVNK